MKKLVYILIINCCFYIETKSQINLVPNPSFEEYWICPTGYSQLYKAKYWQNGGASPDYFNCGLSGGVPKNTSGFQYPSSGNAYAGGATFGNIIGQKNIREMIYVKLINNLIIGEKYFVSFKVSPSYSYNNYHNIFTNNLSALFTTYSLDSMNGKAPNKTHVLNTSIINDTTNWTRIKGSFIADSNYKYLVLGNLLDSTTIQVDSTIANLNGLFANSAYCYFDDVCVSTDSIYSYNYVPTETKSYFIQKNEIFIFPSPINEIINIESNVFVHQINIYDINGQNILTEKENIPTYRYSIPFFKPAGVYFIEIIDFNNNKNIFKLIKNTP